MSEQLVVVGVDGSPASYTALRWALGGWCLMVLGGDVARSGARGGVYVGAESTVCGWQGRSGLGLLSGRGLPGGAWGSPVSLLFVLVRPAPPIRWW